MGTDDGRVHREVMELRATPAQVREFIMTPERMASARPGKNALSPEPYTQPG